MEHLRDDSELNVSNTIVSNTIEHVSDNVNLKQILSTVFKTNTKNCFGVHQREIESYENILFRIFSLKKDLPCHPCSLRENKA